MKNNKESIEKRIKSLEGYKESLEDFFIKMLIFLLFFAVAYLCLEIFPLSCETTTEKINLHRWDIDWSFYAPKHHLEENQEVVYCDEEVKYSDALKELVNYDTDEPSICIIETTKCEPILK